MKLKTELKQELVSFLKKKLDANARPKIKIISPYALSQDELQSLKNKVELLDKSEIILEVDPTLMAGVILQYGSQMIDLSLRGELQKLEQTLYETA